MSIQRCRVYNRLTPPTTNIIVFISENGLTYRKNDTTEFCTVLSVDPYQLLYGLHLSILA